MLKVFFYCQHVLGVGHLFRALTLCRALAPFPVTLVSGGRPIRMELPGNTELLHLPPLEMDENFSGLFSFQGRDPELLKQQRVKLLKDFFESQRPDLFLVELYPFGRKAFRFELDPLLETIAAGAWGRVGVAASVRDILVKKEPRHEARALATLNRYFDAVLVHGDPAVAQLGETFSRAGEIEVPVHYTGYVARTPLVQARPELRRELGLDPGAKLVVVSVGGGNVGQALLETALEAARMMGPDPRVRFLLFAGAHPDPGRLEGLKARAPENVELREFGPDFFPSLCTADLSVSMAGYNTCMDVLAAGVPALLRPFDRNAEQPRRARRLSRLARVEVLEGSDPAHWVEKITGLLENPPPAGRDIDLGGAERTAAILKNLYAEMHGNGG